MDITRKVGDVEYTFQRMKTMDSLIFQATLMKMSGSGLSGGDFFGSDGFQVIGAIMSGSDPVKVANFIKDTIRKMVVYPIDPGKNGTSESFDKYYQDKSYELLDAFVACLIVQGGDVIDALKKKLMDNGLDLADFLPFLKKG